MSSSPLGSTATGSTPISSAPGRPGGASPHSRSRASTQNIRDDLRRYAAEGVGTALLVFVGVGVAVLAPGAGPVGIALAFGLVLAVLTFAIGPVSGCHINPAVTLGMLLAGRIPSRQALIYVLSQIVGAVVGAALVLAVAENRAEYSRTRQGLGANGWGTHSSGGYGFVAAAIVELILTTILVLTVLRLTAEKDAKQFAGVPIGLALLVAHLVAVPIDGTSVNPARSIGPALLQGGTALTQLWLFIIAPLIGAVIAVAIDKFLAPRADDAGNGKAAPAATARLRYGTAVDSDNLRGDAVDSSDPTMVIAEHSHESPQRPRKRNKSRRKRR